jgi:hypothetical protein
LEANILTHIEIVLVLVLVITNRILIVLIDERTALHWACSAGKDNIVQYLLEKNASIDTVDDSGWTPIMSATSRLILCKSLLTDIVDIIIL